MNDEQKGYFTERMHDMVDKFGDMMRAFHKAASDGDGLACTRASLRYQRLEEGLLCEFTKAGYSAEQWIELAMENGTHERYADVCRQHGTFKGGDFKWQ